MTSAPTALDDIAAILVIIILVISALTLFGMGILMAVSAVFSQRPLVTSWPSTEEPSFAVYEGRSSSSNSQAWALGLLGAVGVFVFTLAVYWGVEPDKKDITKDMNMSNLTKKRTPAAAPAPKPDTAAPAEAPPKSDTPPAAPAPKQ